MSNLPQDPKPHFDSSDSKIIPPIKRDIKKILSDMKQLIIENKRILNSKLPDLDENLY